MRENRQLARANGAVVESLQERAYEAIKRRIITLKYHPGAYLNESSICLELGLGRMPVHQALKRLDMEGMVQVLPRKGVVVNPITLDEVKDLIEVRAPNEGLCAALAAERATAQDIEGMREILERAVPLTEQRDHEGLMDLDREFHQAIAAAARNRVLADLLSRLHDRALRFWFVSLSDIKQLQRVQREHRAVFEAIAAHDSDKASAAIRSHIASFGRSIGRAI